MHIHATSPHPNHRGAGAHNLCQSHVRRLVRVVVRAVVRVAVRIVVWIYGSDAGSDDESDIGSEMHFRTTIRTQPLNPLSG